MSTYNFTLGAEEVKAFLAGAGDNVTFISNDEGDLFLTSEFPLEQKSITFDASLTLSPALPVTFSIPKITLSKILENVSSSLPFTFNDDSNDLIIHLGGTDVHLSVTLLDGIEAPEAPRVSEYASTFDAELLSDSITPLEFTSAIGAVVTSNEGSLANATVFQVGGSRTVQGNSIEHNIFKAPDFTFEPFNFAANNQNYLSRVLKSISNAGYDSLSIVRYFDDNLGSEFITLLLGDSWAITLPNLDLAPDEFELPNARHLALYSADISPILVGLNRLYLATMFIDSTPLAISVDSSGFTFRVRNLDNKESIFTYNPNDTQLATDLDTPVEEQVENGEIATRTWVCEKPFVANVSLTSLQSVLGKLVGIVNNDEIILHVTDNMIRVESNELDSCLSQFLA